MSNALWSLLLRAFGEVFAQAKPVAHWYIEAHQFRIDTAEGIGRPTPEGAHRDGVDYVAVILVNRNNVRGGETRVFEAEGIAGVRFTMTDPWTTLLLDDARVIHETTPIQPAGEGGVRDTLVLTYRESGFQSPREGDRARGVKVWTCERECTILHTPQRINRNTPHMPSFAARLKHAIAAHSPLCVGIDPSAPLLKSCGLPDTAEGALEFGERVLDAAQFQISVIKPQSAFFERFGSDGFRAMEALTQRARARDVLVLIDGKRGDIDTTAEAYAEGYFSPGSPLRADAVTTHAYLGFEALEKFLAIAIRNDAGVFVVVRSSNPEGRELQQAKLANGESVAGNLSRLITQRNARAGNESIGSDRCRGWRHLRRCGADGRGTALILHSGAGRWGAGRNDG